MLLYAMYCKIPFKMRCYQKFWNLFMRCLNGVLPGNVHVGARWFLEYVLLGNFDHTLYFSWHFFKWWIFVNFFVFVFVNTNLGWALFQQRDTVFILFYLFIFPGALVGRTVRVESYFFCPKYSSLWIWLWIYLTTVMKAVFKISVRLIVCW